MTAEEYIQTKLAETKAPSGREPITESDELVAALYAALTTKKFRKFAMSDELKAHVRAAIELNVQNGNPINITFLHGAYKLWRLEESPEVDWAELFALMRYINWVKPVCDMYEPGVVMDFFVDDYIVPMLNNVPYQDIDTYIASYQALMDFLKDYRPANMQMTISPVGQQFASKEAFEESVYANLSKLEAEQGGTLPEIDDKVAAMIELNAIPNKQQLADPKWKEKVWNLHNAYSATKAEPGYHKDRPEKILAFTSSLPMAIGVGSTKKAVMKFWIGAGVLRRDGHDFDQDILSPAQLEQTQAEWEQILGLSLPGKNFSRVRVV